MKAPQGKGLLWAGLGVLACGALVAWGMSGTSTVPRVTPAGAPLPPPTDLVRLSLRTGLALAAVMALILGCAVLARRYGVRPARRAARALEVVDRLDLAPKRALYSVRAGGRVVLVGVTDTAITPVLEWSAEEGSRLYPPGPAERAPLFASLLQNVVAKAKSA